MKATFKIQELQAEVEPDKLEDVLDSLMASGFIESYLWDFSDQTVTLDVPKNVEVAELMSGLTQLQVTGRKRYPQ